MKFLVFTKKKNEKLKLNQIFEFIVFFKKKKIFNFNVNFILKCLYKAFRNFSTKKLLGFSIKFDIFKINYILCFY